MEFIPIRNWSIRYDESGRFLGDWFNVIEVEGYNDMERWINNINYIHQLSLSFFNNYDIIEIDELRFGEWQNLHVFFETIERNIEIINRNTLNLNIEHKTWTAMGSLPYVTDYNRIEQFMLNIKRVLEVLQPSRRLLEDGSYRLLENSGIRLLEARRRCLK